MPGNKSDSLVDEQSPRSVQGEMTGDFETKMDINNKENSGSKLPRSVLRETGIVEKICDTYGFIQCCDRDARLFFHFTEFPGITEASVGSSVEFQMHYDRRTGKPLACKITRLDRPATMDIIGEEKYFGIIVQEAHRGFHGAVNDASRKKVGDVPQATDNDIDSIGQIMVEVDTGTFCIDYTWRDVDGMESGKLSKKPKVKDYVSFYVATDKRTKAIRATKVATYSPSYSVHCNGVITSVKATYGFIERDDVVREVFFHFTDLKEKDVAPCIGDEVSFDIQMQDGKETAVNVENLPPGTVKLEEVQEETVRGTIIRTLRGWHSKRASQPMPGRILYEPVAGYPISIQFGERDQVGEYTTYPGDICLFQIAVDRRDGLQHATNIQLLNETFKVHDEKREQGSFVVVKDGYGFIRCSDRLSRMFFHFNELLDATWVPRVGDDVEFSVITDHANPTRKIASRIKRLPNGTVVLRPVSQMPFLGEVVRRPTDVRSRLASLKRKECGQIEPVVGQPFLPNDMPKLLHFTVDDVEEAFDIPMVGEKVVFYIQFDKLTGQQYVASVRPLNQGISAQRYEGYIAALKENFGFIEASDHSHEIFFHYSALLDVEPDELRICDQVEYSLTRKNGRTSADSVTVIKRNGDINPEKVCDTIYNGKIVRPLRIVDPEQGEYPGLVSIEGPSSAGESDGNPVLSECYPFGITGVTDPCDFLQAGDRVTFKFATVLATGAKRATCVTGLREKLCATVSAVKGSYGFIDYEATAGRKLFFHATEVKDRVDLKQGDVVEFVVVKNQRNGKYTACAICKVETAGVVGPASGDGENERNGHDTEVKVETVDVGGEN